MKGGDFLIQAQSGTGKTAASIIGNSLLKSAQALGILQRIDVTHNQIQGLIALPTRALTMDTERVSTAR